MAGSICLTGEARASVDLTPILTLRPQNGPFVEASGPGLTYGGIFELEAVPRWLRLCFTNEYPTAWRVDGAAIAVIPGFNPTPDHALWQRVGFGQAGQDSPPTAGLGGPMGLDIEGVAAGKVPELLFSDWVRIGEPISPTPDGRYLVMIRTYSEGVMRSAIGRHFGSGSIDPSIGRMQAGFWSAGDGTRPPWLFQPNRMDQFYPTYGLQYVSDAPGATILGIGDSILSSMHSAGGVSGPGLRAAMLISKTARPVSYANQAFVGRPSANFLARGRRDIAVLKPQIAVIQAWSEADPWTTAGADAACDAALSLAGFARSHGCLPILVGPAPVFSIHPEGEASRRHSLTRIRALATEGMAVLDVDAIWGTGEMPNSYQTRYNIDQTHPNDAGCAAAAQLLAAALRQLI